MFLKISVRKVELIIMASGSEVSLAYEVCEKLVNDGIGTRLVSMPCMDEFEKQSREYKKSVTYRNQKR